MGHLLRAGCLGHLGNALGTVPFWGLPGDGILERGEYKTLADREKIKTA